VSAAVRPLVELDIEVLAPRLAALPLLVRYGRGAEALARDLKAALTRGDGLLVHDAGEGTEGLAWFHSTGTFALGGYLRLLAVAPGVERRGAGTALLHAYEAEVARASRHAFALVSDFNRDAQRFYERHGYRRAGALEGLVVADVSELIYWKRLRG